jgi:hypothetical protein
VRIGLDWALAGLFQRDPVSLGAMSEATRSSDGQRSGSPPNGAVAS